MTKQNATHQNPFFRRPVLSHLTAFALLAATGASAFAAETAALPHEETLKRLKEGNERYLAGKPKNISTDAKRRAQLALGQKPFAIIVSCSDSRVGPEMVLDQGAGELFIVRSAGHVVAEIGLGSIEYAVENPGAALILVLGHERCGAVAAAVAGGEAPGNIPSIVNAIKPAVAKTKGQTGDAVDNATRANVLNVVAQLQQAGPLLAERVKSGKLKVVGGRYDLDSGRVEVIE